MEMIGALRDPYPDVGRRRETKNEPRPFVNPGRSLPLPEDSLLAVPFLQDTRDRVARDQAKTLLYEEPRDDALS
jgi:hypothetical protein